LVALFLLTLTLALPAAAVQVEPTEYGGWPNCYRLSNGTVELIVTTDVGPRVIRYGFVGEANEFGEVKDQLGQTGGQEWRIYGGHRLWHAPEGMPRSYFPDNFPVEIQLSPGKVRLTQATEDTTGIQKEILLELDSEGSGVKVTHVLRNNGMWAVQLAAWALTMMEQKGKAIIPQPPYAPHPESLLPARPLVQWTYTLMDDPRWHWGARYITLAQDPNATTPQKIGVGNYEGWVAYARAGHLFVKTFQPVRGATYPDFGCTVETFTNSWMLEVETLGPLTLLQPGESLEHVEVWHLFRDVPMPTTEADIDAHILPLVKQCLP